MPELVGLVHKIGEFGYACEELQQEERRVTCVVSGAQLGNMRSFLVANEEVCSVGAFLGELDQIPSHSRYSLLVDLLELNFIERLASISLLRASQDAEADPPSVPVVLAETVFFWPDISPTKFNGRMRALRHIARAASQLLAARGGLAESNPFYQELRDNRSALANAAPAAT